MALWYQFTDDVELCTEAINEIYTKETQRKVFTENQVKEAFELLSKGGISIKEPKFFNSIIDYVPILNNTEHCLKYSATKTILIKSVILLCLSVKKKMEISSIKIYHKSHICLYPEQQEAARLHLFNQ